jgi:hypothetical protein
MQHTRCLSESNPDESLDIHQRWNGVGHGIWERYLRNDQTAQPRLHPHVAPQVPLARANELPTVCFPVDVTVASLRVVSEVDSSTRQPSLP